MPLWQDNVEGSKEYQQIRASNCFENQNLEKILEPNPTKNGKMDAKWNLIFILAFSKQIENKKTYCLERKNATICAEISIAQAWKNEFCNREASDAFSVASDVQYVLDKMGSHFRFGLTEIVRVFLKIPFYRE